MQERIVGPAMGDGVHIWSLPSPASHTDVWLKFNKPRASREGFLTNRSRFVSRSEAMQIARAADQLVEPSDEIELKSPLLRKWKKS